MTKPPLVERAEERGLVCAPELAALGHVLAGERGRMRAGTTIAALAPWIASALPPGVPLFVAGAEPVPEDPDVRRVETLEAEAPYDLLAVEGGRVAGLLVPGGLALVAGAAEQEAGIASATVGRGLTLVVRLRL